MILTVAGFKGGVGKTTSAIHIASYFARLAPTILIDGDPNRSATAWAKSGKLPFKVVDERLAARYARDFTHMVFDTQARPTEEDLKVLSEGCDLLVVPTTPDALALDALMLTVSALRSMGSQNYAVLVTIVPPRPSRDGEEANKLLVDAGLPVFPSMVRRYVAFQKAALQGVPVYDVEDPRAQDAWSDYEAIGKEISG